MQAPARQHVLLSSSVLLIVIRHCHARPAHVHYQCGTVSAFDSATDWADNDGV